MAAELTKVYRTADGRLFERDDRDAARAHDAWLELVAWVDANVVVDEPGNNETPSSRLEIAHTIATSTDLAAILKRKPTEAPPP